MHLLFAHNHPIWDPRAGGGQRVNHDLATYAVRAGHQAWVLHVGAGAPAEPWPVEYTMIVLPDRRRLLLNALSVAAAARAWARRHPDGVVMASAPEAGLVADSLPSGVGVVATCHHPDPPNLPRLPWGSAPVKALVDLRSHQAHFLHARMLRKAHVRTVPSAWSREALIARGYLDRRSAVEVVPNGVAGEWFEGPAGSPAEGCDILFVGRLEVQKGVDVLIRALAEPGLQAASARLIGAGPDEARYRRLAGELRMADRIRFDGFRDQEHIRRSAAVARVLVLPSRAESFGLVALEAMAFGLPVVVSAVGGLPEFALHEENALLVPPGDPAALAQAVGRLLQDAALRDRLVEGGRRTAARHTWADITVRYVELAAEARRRARGEVPP